MTMKYNSIICILLLAGIGGLFGCQPLGPDIIPDSIDGERTLTISAFCEQETRATIDDDLSFGWTYGDLISVYAGSSLFVSEPYSGNDAYVVKLTGQRSNYAFYPAAIADSDNCTSSSLKVTLPSEYHIPDSVSHYWSPMPMIATNEEGQDLHFMHLGGLFRIIMGDVPVETDHIIVDMGQDITGSFPVYSDSNGSYIKVDDSFNSTTYVTFYPSNLEQLILNLPLPVGEYSGSVSIKIETADNTILFEKTAPINWNCERAYGKKFSFESIYWDVLDEIDDISLTGFELRSAFSDTVIVNSYRYFSSSDKSPIAWKAQVSTDDGATWADYGDTNWPAWLTMSRTTGLGGSQGDTVALSFAPDADAIVTTTAISTAGTDMVSILRSAEVVGTADAPRDLSLYNIYGLPHADGAGIPSIKTAGAHTSNCYVVSAPGYYCFPLVYGNAYDVDHGGENVPAYKSKRSSAYPYAPGGNGIPNPYVVSSSAAVKDYRAEVVWQDAPEHYESIRDGVQVIPAPSGAGVSGCRYIKFHIAPEDILPGNIVIAVTHSGRVYWSWHIWVTAVPNGVNDDFAINELTYRPTSTTTNKINILNCNLGWSPALNCSTAPSSRNAKIRIVPLSGEADPIEFRVSGESSSYSGGAYSNTFYQWGRKDPFLPSAGNAALAKCYVSPSGYQLLEDDSTIHLAEVSVPQGWILNPTSFNHSVNTNLRTDLWNYNVANATTISNSDPLIYGPVGKTVYDPCPAGFCVPIGKAFTGFTRTGNASSTNNPVYGVTVDPVEGITPRGVRYTYNGTNATDSYTLYFPNTGSIQGSYNATVGSYLVGGNNAGTYWTAIPSYSTTAYRLNSVSGTSASPLTSIARTFGHSIRPMVEMPEE